MGVVLVSSSDVGLCFLVSSSSRSGEGHDVYFDVDNGWVCTCEHHYFRKVSCKHIGACKDFLLEDKGYTVVGVSAFGVLEFSGSVLDFVVGCGCYCDML